MIVDGSVLLNVSDLEESLDLAKTLLPPKWLTAQHKLSPRDPLLLHLKPEASPKFIIHCIRHGLPNEMHPLAEAVLVGKEIVAQYKQDGRFLGSNLLYLLKALADIVKAKSRIENLEERLSRLMGEGWKPTLYELLVAAAYSKAALVKVIQEGDSHAPDLEVRMDPPIFVECKAKLKYEESITEFLNRWSREALGHIVAHLRKVDAGFIVRIRVTTNISLAEIPRIVEDMVAQGERSKSIRHGHIDIELFESSEVSLPEAMSVISEDFWRWVLQFTEWREWHDVQPGGMFQLTNLSNAIAHKVKRPLLICIRRDDLADNTQRVYSTLKFACEKQFKSHTPGIIHMAVNTDLFGLGDKGEPVNVRRILTAETEKLFRNYTRIYKVIYDIVSPPPPGKYNAKYSQLVMVNDRCQNPPGAFCHSPRILLW